ncbi:hypothetical protein GQ457_15G020900 [Hibiscus cannabinus]
MGDAEVAEEGRQSPETTNLGTGIDTGFITHLFYNFVNGGTVGDGENLTEQVEKDRPVLVIGGKVEAFDDTSTTATENEAEEEGSGDGSDGGGGEGFINNLMSNLFHHSKGEVGDESKNKKQKVEVEVAKDEIKAEKTENEGKSCLILFTGLVLLILFLVSSFLLLV